MKKGKNIKDPFADREAVKYQNPIPSREFILDFLAQEGRAFTYEELGKALVLGDEEQWEGLRRRLIAMVRDAQLLCNRRGAYGLVNKMDLIPGLVQAHRDGYGFLIPEHGGEDLFLSARQMRQVFDKDRVLVRAGEQDFRGRKEAVIVEILERNTEFVVGRFISEQGIHYLIPSAKNLVQDIVIPADKTLQANNGQIVRIKLLAYPDKFRQAVGEVIEILGEHMDPGMEIDVAILAHHIPNDWSEELEQDVLAIPLEVTESDLENRTDLRHLPIVTIDGEDAKDFDDAVYCTPRNDGAWRLIVAIADVSYYVQPNSTLDQEAEKRGNSVYFPEQVIPMLPEKLSNGLCSLNPYVDRLCMVCDMLVSAEGKVTKYRFYDAVIHSKARLTYTKVYSMLQGDRNLQAEYQDIFPHLENLQKLYHALRHQREIRGALDFDTTETRIIFGPNKKIEKIVPVFRNEAHMLIEECMLAANVSAAKLLKKHKIPALYRIHEPPKEDKLMDLRRSLALYGFDLKGGATPKSGDYQKLLQQVRTLPNAQALQTLILRSLNQAEYNPVNEGHFGLGYAEYAHFTSPIRRYPDLLTHRAIRHFLKGGTAEDFAYTENMMQTLGERCSMTERRADDAVRDVVSWLKCEYMSHHVGEEFTGKVTTVTAFGLFVELNQVYVEGLVHVTSLKNDYYHYDKTKHVLIGEKTHIKYGMGQIISVRVLRVDIDQRQIDFELLEVKNTRKKPKKS
jgi:ribonuclease R